MINDLSMNKQQRYRLPLSLNPSTWFINENPFERLGRFWWFRGLYSRFRSLQQVFEPTPKRYHLNITQTLFPELDSDLIEGAIDQLRKNAIAPGITLPKQTTTAILNYAHSSRCFEPGRKQPFYITDIKELQPNDARVYRGLVECPERCPEITRLIHDPKLLTIIHRYLHYWPTKITAHLTWSLAVPLSLKTVQQAYPSTRYHYDIAGFNFMTVYFYITSVLDSEDGAHIMIPGTHKRKPLKLMLSGNHPDHVIDHYFGLNRAISILGQAGFGFIQDPSCIHRLQPPTNHHRLLLQLRYS